MKTNAILWIVCSSFILGGCITDFNPKGIDGQADMLVVEGIITDDESMFTLSKSLQLTVEENDADSYRINFAKVYVECDDGTSWQSDSDTGDNGRYTVKTGPLNPARKYRLKIEIEEPDCNGNQLPCPVKTFEYVTGFSAPIQTPAIDSVFWRKRDRGHPVMIYVATHAPDNSVMYCRWSYREDWQINSEYISPDYPYICWNMANSNDLLLGSAEKTVYGQLTGMLTEKSPSERRFSVLYRIDVTQNAISKQAYDYFANVRKNVRQTGGIFAPIPSEIRGNITCTTDPDRPVIGYVEVSTTAGERLYISNQEVYEPPFSTCRLLNRAELCEELGVAPAFCGLFEIPNWYVPLEAALEAYYIRIECVDCTRFGTVQKPDDWPDSY